MQAVTYITTPQNHPYTPSHTTDVSTLTEMPDFVDMALFFVWPFSYPNPNPDPDPTPSWPVPKPRGSSWRCAPLSDTAVEPSVGRMSSPGCVSVLPSAVCQLPTHPAGSTRRFTLPHTLR